MARAEHGDVCLRLAHRLEQQHRGAAAALAETGAQAEALQAGVLGPRGEHFPGNGLGPVFQVAAADGVVEPLGADHHLRAGVARGRAAFLDDGHQDARFAATLQLGQGADPVHLVILPIAAVQAGSTAASAACAWAAFSRRICSTPQSTRSGVAGASMAGCAR